MVVSESIAWGKVTPDMTWEKQLETQGQQPGFTIEYAVTKERAINEARKCKAKGKLVFSVKCGLQTDFSGMGWMNYDQQSLSEHWFFRC